MTDRDQGHDGVWNTDDAHPIDVLRMLALCAGSWEPGVRLLGNVRASDIVRACNEAVKILGGDGERESATTCTCQEAGVTPCVQFPDCRRALGERAEKGSQ